MTEWIVTSCLLILVVLLLRSLLGKRISARLRYGLWAVVLVRLLVPVPLFSVTVPQLPKWTPPEAMQEESIYVLPVDNRPVAESGVHVFEDGTLGDPNSFGYPRLTDDGERVVRYADRISPLELLGWVWAAGAAVMGAVLVAANLRFSIRLRRMRKSLEGTSAPVPVYVAAGLPSPCLMGVLRPAVYVTEESAADPAMLRHVLAHELTHYGHLDHVWSVLRGAALAVHWWNPLVWLAVVCSRRDGELACDEGALKRLGDGERAAYGETLLALVTAKSRPGDLLCFATTMTGGKRSLKERIQRIARQPKTLVSAMAAVIVVAALSSVVAFGQAKEAPEEADAPDGEPLPVETQAPDADAWRTVDFVLTVDGVLELGYDLPVSGVEIVRSNPIPAPREWTDDDLAGRSEATALVGLPQIWGGLVTPTDGWLVACYERGVAAADTYVYKTADGGLNWTETGSMLGTSWHISDVGFLSPDRLIVAQRRFDGAPCFITKDGGETWEEIELPDRVERLDEVIELPCAVVQEIWSDGREIIMDIGQNESDPMVCVMISEDLGYIWHIEPVVYIENQDPLRWTPDLDRDGKPDTLMLRESEDAGHTLWTLQVIPRGMNDPIWEGEAAGHHTGWTSFFLCQMDGEDFLLQYSPYMSTGIGDYSYKLFYLTADGEEVAVQENSVGFDVNFDLDGHEFYPETISAFMEEINALLAQSTLLVNTDENLISTFQKEGRLYDSLWWLDEGRDGSLALLDALRNYEKYAKGYPDGSGAFPEMDLDHDGKPDTLDLRTGPDPSGWSYDGTLWTLQCGPSGGGSWWIEGRPSLPGENAVFLCRMDGEDYLLVYTPEFWHGQGYYDYRLIWLDGGREVVVQENSVAFDTRFRGGPDDIGFDPEAISAFMDEVNALLANSVQLVNTNIYLEYVFAGHGRLYDDLYWLDDKFREEGLTLLEVLQNYKSYCGDHPDDAWSPLADLLEGLTEEDFATPGENTAELVQALRAAERGSRFYTWNNYAAACDGLGVDDRPSRFVYYTLADGSELYLFASEENDTVLMMLQAPGGATKEIASAYYTAPELNGYIKSIPVILD